MRKRGPESLFWEAVGSPLGVPYGGLFRSYRFSKLRFRMWLLEYYSSAHGFRHPSPSHRRRKFRRNPALDHGRIWQPPTSGGTSVISVFDEACRWAAGVRYGVTPGGVPERLASRTPPRPNQIFADLIGPMAFILAVRVSRRASDTHMPSGKMSRQRGWKF